jgi:transposase
MSLKPDPIQPVPEETARVAKAAFRKGNPLLSLRDELGAIFADADFADLFPKLGQPGLPPWRLALVTLLQFRENLADRQAADEGVGLARVVRGPPGGGGEERAG